MVSFNQSDCEAPEHTSSVPECLTLADLGEGLHQATVLEWFVQPGQAVAAGENLLAVETAKAIVDIPAPFAAVVERLCAEVNKEVEVGQPLLFFRKSLTKNANSNVAEKTNNKKPADKNTENSNQASNQVLVGTLPQQSDQFFWQDVFCLAPQKIKPLSEETRINTVKNTNGYEAREEVVNQQAVQAATSTAAATATVAQQRLRQQMARQMTAANEVTTTTLFDQVEISHWPSDADLTVNLLQAMVSACQQQPLLNAWFDAGADGRQQLLPRSSIDIGLAMNTEQGLLVPVLGQCQQLNAQQLRERVNQLKQQAHNRSLKPRQLQGAGIMLSNFASLAGRFATPVVVPPCVAILAVGAPFEQPKLIEAETKQKNQQKSEQENKLEGKQESKQQWQNSRYLPLSLSFDHRALTGAEAAHWLKALKTALSG